MDYWLPKIHANDEDN